MAPSPKHLRLPMPVRPWLGAVLISFSGVWVRLADVEAARSAFWRGAYALPVLALLVALRAGAARAATVPGGGVPPRRWIRPLAIVAGMILGLDLVAWHASIAIVGAGLGTVLPNLQVVVVGLLGVLLFRERPPVLFWLSLPVVLAGIWLLAAVGRPVVTDGSVALGVLLGVVAGVTYGISLVVLRLARGTGPVTSAVEILWSLTLGIVVVTGAAAAWEGVLGPAGWPASGWLLLLALGSQVVGWLLLTSSIHHLPAAATSVALLLQPVLALVWGALLLSEPIGLPQVLGAAVVLLGVALAHRSLREVQATASVPSARSGPLGASPDGHADSSEARR
ncbi:MAG: DMT family transporter [Nitriliruptoraceae bacterium]